MSSSSIIAKTLANQNTDNDPDNEFCDIDDGDGYNTP
jgi:hypothetical protein